VQLLEAAPRSFALGGAVRLSLAQPADRMTASAVVLMASLSMPVLMHWATVPIAAYSSARSNHGAAASGYALWFSVRNLGNAITNADGRFQVEFLAPWSRRDLTFAIISRRAHRLGRRR
jgi:hypothetical protein